MATRPTSDRPGTRILATLGPSSDKREVLEAMVDAGATAFRLNFSHGTPEEKLAKIALIRAVSDARQEPLAIVGDLSGPKLRTKDVAGGDPVQLETGTAIVITPNAAVSSGRTIAVDYEGLPGDVRQGDRILIDDGSIEVTVDHIDGGDVHAIVKHGGLLLAHKGLNLPGVRLSIPPITPKDVQDLEVMIDAGVDMIAMSFVRDAADVVDLKRRISERGAGIPVIAKIEKPEAVSHIDEILDIADGIMVARGDLGVEMSPEHVPVVQKQLIAKARRKSRVVITATQMLESMRNSPRPTRAEASDVANAIFDGTDVVMLSAETATGSYPVEAVRTMADIARIVEMSEGYGRAMEPFHLPPGQGVVHAAVRASCVASEEVGARAIIPFTASGWTAFLVAGMRPKTPVIACTYNVSTYHRLALCFGVTSVLIPQAKDIDDLYVIGMQRLLASGLIDAGDVVVVLTGSVVRGSGANTIKIHRVGTADLSDNPETRRRLRSLIKQASDEP